MREMVAALASVVLATGAVYLLYSSMTKVGETPRERRTGRKKKRRKRKTSSLKALAARNAANLEKDVMVETAQVQKGYKKQATRDVVVETAHVQKGYKKTAAGRTTSYFHREIDEEAKKLIGSTAPKRIVNQKEVAMAQQLGTTNQTRKKGGMAGSAWNANGQTWEDRTITLRVWKKIIVDLYDAPMLESPARVALMAYSLEQTSMCGDVVMKWKNKLPAFIFDITVKLRVLNLDGDIILRSTVYHMSGDDCSVEFSGNTDNINNPVLDVIRQNIVQRTSLFEERLKKQLV